MAIALFVLLALLPYPIWCVFTQKRVIDQLNGELHFVRLRNLSLEDGTEGLKVRYEKRNTERAQIYDAQLMQALSSRDRYREELEQLKGVIQSVPVTAVKKATKRNGTPLRRRTKGTS